ncbi:MAG: phytanoyl-CoA dioxygenase family protein, partial [Pseudomonadota bacterium]
MNTLPDAPLSAARLQEFQTSGYLIERGLADAKTVAAMNAIIADTVNPALAPVEYEADVHYPGSPVSKNAPGGQTPRRLLNAYARDVVFRDWARSTGVVQRLEQMLNCQRVMVSQNHHNCIMTKHPGFSSVTSWHQDMRYWSFDEAELVSVWLALGDETPDNGGLLLIPGSHMLELPRGRLDAALFLRTDIEENQQLIEQAIPAELSAGDTLFFHCRTFHAASQNDTDALKRSLVYTYHTPPHLVGAWGLHEPAQENKQPPQPAGGLPRGRACPE